MAGGMDSDMAHGEEVHGNFRGHVLPGSIFLALGVFHVVSALYWKFFRGGLPTCGWYPLDIKVPIPRTQRQVPLTLAEPLVVLVAGCLASLGELFNLDHRVPTWRFLYNPDDGYRTFFMGHMNNYQHVLMYASFAAVSAANILAFHARRVVTRRTGAAAVAVDADAIAQADCATPEHPSTRAALVEFCDGLCNASRVLAFGIEFLLLIFHLKGGAVERRVHLILAITVAVGAVAAALVLARPKSLGARLCLGWAFIIQGTWFVHIAFILFRNNPHWKGPMAEMMLPVEIAAHMLLAAAFVAALTVSAGLAAVRSSVRLQYDPVDREAHGKATAVSGDDDS
ncbi:unnamed protein product [Pedinophyceae sp. YPF-701]|nr:unnamed protein product [Pedinophyceae sp. YPF-701]